MLFVGIGFIFLTLAGMVLFLAGTVFNWVVLRTVFQFGEYFGTSDGMLIAWGVMRDIANIGLLFGFILMGVLLILNVEGGGHGHGGGLSAKRAIPRLIIFAVLLNFSLFASQFVIDVANAFGSSFTSLAGTECSTAVTGSDGNAGGQSLEECTNLGISGKIIQAAGLTNIFGDGRGDLQAILSNLTGRPYSYAVSLIMLSIFVLVTAFVLLAGAIMLAIRVVILSFLMVTSPVGFAGMVIPGLSGIASKWWHTLISQSFFAPVYLLLIFISIKLTEGLMRGEATLTNALIADRGNAISGNIQVVMVFIIVIGFMIASLIMAQKMGAIGAKFASNSAAALTLGSAGFIGRRTLGVAAESAAKGVARSSWARNNGFGSRTAYNLLNKGATSSFSLRSGIAGVGGLEMDKAGKNVSHGIHGIVEKEVKARKEFADKGLKQTKGEEKREADLKKEKELITQYKDAVKDQEKREETQLASDEKGLKAASSARLAAIAAQESKVDSIAARGDSTEEEFEAEQKILADLQAAHEEQSKVEAADLAARKDAFKARQERYKSVLSDYDTRSKQIDREINGYEEFDPNTRQIVWRPGVSQDSARRTYGEALKSQHGLPWPSVGHHVNEEAGAEIVKKLKKSKRDKLIDAIKENAKEEDKESGGDDHGEKKSSGGGEKKASGGGDHPH